MDTEITAADADYGDYVQAGDERHYVEYETMTRRVVTIEYPAGQLKIPVNLLGQLGVKFYRPEHPNGVIPEAAGTYLMFEDGVVAFCVDGDDTWVIVEDGGYSYTEGLSVQRHADGSPFTVTLPQESGDAA